MFVNITYYMEKEKDVVITYESLYELFRREKVRPELQKLDENFFKDIINYLDDKKSILESQTKKDSIFSNIEVEKTKKQLEGIKRMIKELYERRESKIIQLALLASKTNNNQDLNTLLPEEKMFYEEILKTLNKTKSNILSNLLNSKMPTMSEDIKNIKPKGINIDPKEEKYKLIRILSPLPKFMGSNLEIYGPFDQENIANIPLEIADLLIKNKKAEEIK